jgi:protein N-terminal amidase
LRDEDDARAVARESARALAWAREIAMTYDTHVALGHCREEATSGELFNSQTVFAPDGDVARRYDKSHLYFVDEAWAVEGRRGFEVFTLAMKCFVRGAGSAYAEVVRDVKCVSAICMDINPYKFEAPWTDFELANACVGSDLILFSSAWTSAHPDDPEEIKRKPVDFGETVSYGMSRLQPLLGKTMSPYFVCANRIGVENDIQFTGCSCIVDLRHRIPRLMLGVREREETALSCWIELGRASDDDDDDDGGETDALGEHNHSDAQ